MLTSVTDEVNEKNPMIILKFHSELCYTFKCNKKNRMQLNRYPTRYSFHKYLKNIFQILWPPLAPSILVSWETAAFLSFKFRACLNFLCRELLLQPETSSKWSSSVLTCWFINTISKHVTVLASDILMEPLLEGIITVDVWSWNLNWAQSREILTAYHGVLQKRTLWTLLRSSEHQDHPAVILILMG